MALGRFLQSLPQVSWMCKKISKIQHKTAYYQSSRICREMATPRCQLPILTSLAFHQMKAGTELQFHCADVRPRSLTTGLKQSVILYVSSSVHATNSLRIPRICSHGNEQTAGKANSWTSICSSESGQLYHLPLCAASEGIMQLVWHRRC